MLMPSEQTSPCRVLCVDDDEATLYAMAKTLGEAGFEVCSAGNYFDALDVLDRADEAIDVLVTDIVLNLGNGFALARIARRHRPALKSIYITAFDLPTVEAAGPVLRKPVDADLLVSAVRDALAGGGADGA
jgi:DNA-binding NtrC family response regulator